MVIALVLCLCGLVPCVTSFMSSLNGLVGNQASCARSQALVPYSPVEIVKPFHEKQRKFMIAEKEWVVLQDWNGLGVAGVVWEGALVLAQYLAENPVLVSGKTVVEVGAGTGLVGMVTAALGALSVVITDKQTEAARRNLDSNKHLLPPASKVSVQEYEWGMQPPAYWTIPYDVVLGADVAYIPDTYSALTRSLKELGSRDSLVLLSCKRRYDKVDKFLSVASLHFDYDEIYVQDNVFVYKLKKR